VIAIWEALIASIKQVTARKSDSVMPTNKGEFAAITFEDGSCAVVQSDPSRPRVFEVIATFYDAARAREYAQLANSQSQRPEESAALRKEEAAEEPAADLSERQQAVLSALRANMDENKLAEVRAAPLAKAAHIPVGSLHSVLTSLEKKQLIRTNRPGSAKAPASYQILDAPK
jgi:uncharacterized membrane protein